MKEQVRGFPGFGFFSERGAVLLSRRHRMTLQLFAPQLSANAMTYAG
jgi:hypothetical protein